MSLKMKINTSILQNALVGLVLIFALITFFGEIANDLQNAINNVTGSQLQGVAVFSIVGILLVLGIMVIVMTGVLGGKKR